MTTLKLKKPLRACDFKIKHGDIEIVVTTYNHGIRFSRYDNSKYEGTCVYRYETPEKGEEFIFEMYRQVVEKGQEFFHLWKNSDLIFEINRYGQIGTTMKSAIYIKPIPQQEFFRQLRERLREIVEVEEDKPQLLIPDLSAVIKELDMAVRRHGYKITIERE